ncbi:MAG: putative zinc-binding peptidase [Opitutaceae bacterium]|nr:putative zinc-binding peptidase [Opitutaceae bacterium]
MFSLFESLSKRLTDSWHLRDTPRRGKSYRCRCGRPVFFRNSLCLGCQAPLGYEPLTEEVRALEPGPAADTWRLHGDAGDGPAYKRCENFDSPAGCNWLVPADDPQTFCLACRLNRTIPSLADADNQRYWRAIEIAKRRLVAQLIALDLPIKSKETEDPEHGLMFDFLRSPPEGPRVLTGHAGGLITLNVEEADDARREKIRHDLREPYRTLLGHFRHEVGHYYWDRLIAGTPWHEPFRALFGDERADYAAALKTNYEMGPPADWRDSFISSYASVHPWEDWAETWAHYMHLTDSLDTALGFGISGNDVETELERFKLEDMYAPNHPDAKRVLSLIHSWLELITVLNELSRSMGQPDFYPFVMSRPVLRKLHFIHLVVKGEPPPA